MMISPARAISSSRSARLSLTLTEGLSLVQRRLLPVRSILSVGLIALAVSLAPQASAQQVRDHSLQLPIPTVIEGPTFKSEAAIAICGNNSIFSFSNLRGTINESVLVPSGTEAMAERWFALNETRALYNAVGADGVPLTNDDALMLVTGLPESPSILDTGLRGQSADYTYVSDNIAVRGYSAGFRFVRHTEQGVSVNQLSVPGALALGFGYGVYPVGDDAVAALDMGADLIAGTADDLLLVVTDLQAGLFTLTVTNLPAGTTARGFTVTETGIGLTWQDGGLPTVNVTIIRDLTNTPTFMSMPVATPANPSASYAPTFRVRAGMGDTCIVSCTDDVGPGEGHALLSDLSSLAASIGTWYDDWNCGCSSEQIAPTAVVTYSAVGPIGFTVNDFATGMNMAHSQPWNNELTFLRPAQRSMISFSSLPGSLAGGNPQALASVFSDFQDVGSATLLSAPGRWAGDGTNITNEYFAPRVEVLASGRTVGFVSSNGGSNIDVLRVISVPTWAPMAAGLSGGYGVTPVALTVPAAQTPLVAALHLNAPTSFAGPIKLWVASRTSVPTALDPLYFAAGSFAHLDVLSINFGFDRQLDSNGFVAVWWNISGVLNALIGETFYAQGVALDSSGYWVPTDCIEVVVR